MKRRIGTLIVMLVGGVLLSMALAAAQQPQPPQPEQQPWPQQQPRPAQPPHPPDDPLGESLFPPELVMQHQREVGLTDEQKAFMRGEIQKVTVRFNELQWQLQDAMEALAALMKESSVNEQQAMAQLEKVLDTEREIKHLHMGMAIRIKNKLTPEQQAKLQAIKRMGPGQGPGPGPGGPHPGPGPRQGPGPAPGPGPNPRPMP
jgi:Spy/CpxP family protein refolding chaperone